MTERDPLNIQGQLVAEKYLIERLVGEGGFAVVYRAMHTIWNKPVAIKFFNGLSSAPVDQRDRFQQAFIQEGALLTELSSQTAGIVQARDVGTFTTPDGHWMPFMVLEWLEGRSLEEVLEAEKRSGIGPWTIEGVIRLLGQAASALEVAHQRGIAHRDVKPANLFVLGDDARAPRATLKVLDFGVAKMMTDNTQLHAALAKTGTNVTSFTPAYGAPEQFTRNLGATGPWTDVFALALVGVEMLTQRLALDGEDVVQLAVCASHPEHRPTPRALGASVSDAVEAVFAKALAVRPQDRFARVGEFWDALQAAVPSTFSTQTPPSRVANAATELAPGILNTGASRTGSGPIQETLKHSSHVTTGASAAVTSMSETGKPRSNAGVVGALLGGVALLGGGAFWFVSKSGSAPQPAPSAAVAAPLAPAPSASASAAPVELVCPERMVKINAGEYFQGSDHKDAQDNEKPAHHVILPAYCIDLYEVTAGEYRACSDQGKCKRAGSEVEFPKITAAEKKLYSTLCTGNDPAKAEHPINCVTWEMSSLFCKAQGKRLPSEAEWEYATRGPDGRVYPWGDEPPTEKHLNACGPECVKWSAQRGVAADALYAKSDGFPTTAPVGQFEKGRSRFGPFDVVGNVWEWVADWYGPYSAEEKTSPAGPASGERRVIRGGAFNGSYESWLRPSFRYAQDPAALSHGIGFRCAK